MNHCWWLKKHGGQYNFVRDLWVNAGDKLSQYNGEVKAHEKGEHFYETENNNKFG